MSFASLWFNLGGGVDGKGGNGEGQGGGFAQGFGVSLVALMADSAFLSVDSVFRCSDSASLPVDSAFQCSDSVAGCADS